MRHTLKDSVIVITGASAAIGRATALRLAAAGAKTVLCGFFANAAPLAELTDEYKRLGGNAISILADVTQQDQLFKVAERAMSEFGHIDAWVNCAGSPVIGRFEDTPSESFRRIVEINLFGYIHSARAVLPYFKRQGYGVLINVSILEGRPIPFTTAYSLSKFAANTFSKLLRQELVELPNICVSTVIPARTGQLTILADVEMTARAIVSCIQNPICEIVADDIEPTQIDLIQKPPAPKRRGKVLWAGVSFAVIGLLLFRFSRSEKAEKRLLQKVFPNPQAAA